MPKRDGKFVIANSPVRGDYYVIPEMFGIIEYGFPGGDIRLETQFGVTNLVGDNYGLALTIDDRFPRIRDIFQYLLEINRLEFKYSAIPDHDPDTTGGIRHCWTIATTGDLRSMIMTKLRIQIRSIFLVLNERPNLKDFQSVTRFIHNEVYEAIKEKSLKNKRK